MDDSEITAFVRYRGELDIEAQHWSAPPQQGQRAEILSSGGPSVRAPCLQDEHETYSWEHLDEGPPESDDSWAAFAPKDGDGRDGKLLASGGKKLTREQRQTRLQVGLRCVLELVNHQHHALLRHRRPLLILLLAILVSV